MIKKKISEYTDNEIEDEYNFRDLGCSSDYKLSDAYTYNYDLIAEDIRQKMNLGKDYGKDIILLIENITGKLVCHK